MPVKTPATFTDADRRFYERAAQEYYDSLPLEHFVESTPQQQQRLITVASFAAIRAKRPDIHCLNEMLIQYPLGSVREIGRVVPDNLVVLHDGELEGTGSFDTPREGAELMLALEYTSDSSRKKDFVENVARYAKLKIQYYAVFDPYWKFMELHKRTPPKRKFVEVKPSRAGMYPLPELELKLGLLDGWIRYWFRGELVPLPDEMVFQIQELTLRLADANLEIQRLRAELARRKQGENGSHSG